MLFNKEQIDKLASDFEKRLCDGEIVKFVLPNSADMYYKGLDSKDLDAILNADKDSPLFVMSMELRG